MATPEQTSRSEDANERLLALSYVAEALAEATLDGVEEDCFAQAALFTALQSLVTTFGEDATAEFAQRLPERIRHGEFSVATRQ